MHFYGFPIGNVWGNFWLAVNVVWSIRFLVGQRVLQSQIARCCVILSMSYLMFLEDLAQCVCTIAEVQGLRVHYHKNAAKKLTKKYNL